MDVHRVMTDSTSTNAPSFAANAPDVSAGFGAAHDGYSASPENTGSSPDQTPELVVDADAPSYEQSAPPLRQEFEEAHNDAEREAFLAERAAEAGLDQDGHSQIATRSELEQRIAERPEPQPAPALTPGGSLETQVHQEVDAEREKRIFLLHRQLESQRGGPTREFTRNR